MFQLHSQMDSSRRASSSSDEEYELLAGTSTTGESQDETASSPQKLLSPCAQKEKFQESLMNNLTVPPPPPPRPSPTGNTSISSYFSRNGKRDEELGVPVVPPYKTDVPPHQVAAAVSSFRALKVCFNARFKYFYS